MRLRSLLLGVILGAMAFPTRAQEVDVATVLADTKTFIFDNGENTVKGYVYTQLEGETNCCGDDRIYLEVKIDPSGYVLAAKPLTGSNDCFKQSAVDIVKNIKWDASEFKGPKSVYFEIKPDIECTEGRDNEYVALEIFNNEMLNPTPDGDLSAPVASSEASEEAEADPEKIEDLINVTAGEETSESRGEASQPAEKDAVAASDEPQEETFEGVVTDEPDPRPADPPAAKEKEPQPKTSAEDVSPSEKADAERVAQQQEIDELRKQLEQMRKQEEQRRKELAAREEARRKREAQMKAQQEAREAQADPQSTEGEPGGLFLAGGEENTEEGSFALSEDLGEEERLRQEIDQLRQQQRELEDLKRQREQDMMRVMEENRRDNQEIIRLEEEIAAREEEAARVREEMEMQRLEEERMQVAEQRQREEEQYQQMMDEIARLQAEAEARIKALEAQKQELNQMAELKKKREQEIALERAIREKERKKRLEEVRLELMNSGTPITNVGGENAEMEDLMADIDLSAEADSEALKILIQQIKIMNAEMARLQQQIRELGGEPTTSNRSVTDYSYSSSSNTGTSTPSNGGTNTRGTTRSAGSNGDDELKNGATDTSWQKLDYRDPNADPSLYPSKPAPQPAAPPQTGTPQTGGIQVDGEGQQGQPAPVVTKFDPQRGYTNNLDDEHDNVPGPKAQVREYIEGRDAMKAKISANLQEAGVCGLAQALFSVTLNPQGDVVSHNVLGANKELVELQLMTVIPTLKFQPASVRFNQTLYLEFKAEIKCEGQESVNLQSVDPILDTKQNK